jgi:glycosyltransferase involved in cell wall biosynthesis
MVDIHGARLFNAVAGRVTMHILALEPYYGGSHQAFLDGWSVHSRHQWTTLGLPAFKWKWRMRHSAVTFAARVAERVERGEVFDLLLCSDMMNLAEFKGLAQGPVRDLPSVAYFHENQLTYPVLHPDERDLHFGMIHFTTTLAASQVWFNSVFHRTTFLDALAVFLSRMPDFNSLERIEEIRLKSRVYPQGIAEPPTVSERLPGPPRILWVARWEHDKNPGLFFETLYRLQAESIDFRVSVIGERFSAVPVEFEQARNRLADRIDRWGYQQSREEYERALAEADIVVSTADHEFFGVGIVEAVSAGVYPLLPTRLAYPEIFASIDSLDAEHFFYDGSADHLTTKLAELFRRVTENRLWEGRPDRLTSVVEKYCWRNLAPQLDDALEKVAKESIIRS